MTRQFTGSELVIATHNEGKMREFEALFKKAGMNIKFHTAASLGVESPPETGTTFVENAILKAKVVAEKTGKVALADDSGICVDALNGAPGVYTADWAEEPGHRDYDYCMEKIHKLLGSNPNRKAAFASVIAVCWPDGHCETVEGYAPGNLIWPPRGERGHGCDPMFVPNGYDITYAEMPAEQKNGISHRAVSFRKIMDKCFKN
jgi:XTP/dITP diphosphohydrolase